MARNRVEITVRSSNRNRLETGYLSTRTDPDLNALKTEPSLRNVYPKTRTLSMTHMLASIVVEDMLLRLEIPIRSLPILKERSLEALEARGAK